MVGGGTVTVRTFIIVGGIASPAIGEAGTGELIGDSIGGIPVSGRIDVAYLFVGVVVFYVVLLVDGAVVVITVDGIDGGIVIIYFIFLGFGYGITVTGGVPTPAFYAVGDAVSRKPVPDGIGKEEGAVAGGHEALAEVIVCMGSTGTGVMAAQDIFYGVATGGDECSAAVDGGGGIAGITDIGLVAEAPFAVEEAAL